MSERDEFEKWYSEEFDVTRAWIVDRRDDHHGYSDRDLYYAYRGHAARAQQAGSGEAVAWVCETSLGKYYGETQREALEECRAFADEIGQEPANITPLYSHPQPAQQGSVPEGWRLITRKTHYQLAHGNEVVATLAGPDAEGNAAKMAALLSTPAAPQPAQQGGVPEVKAAVDRALSQISGDDKCQWEDGYRVALYRVLHYVEQSAATPQPEGDGCKACGGTGFRSAGADKIGTWPCEFCKHPNPPAKGAE